MSEHLCSQVAALSQIIDQLTVIINQHSQPKNDHHNNHKIDIFHYDSNEDLNESQVTMRCSDIHSNSNQMNDVSLEIFNALPIFDGNREKYLEWRSIINTTMQPLINQRNAMKYYEALFIIRGKLIGPASNSLDDNEEFNFENIIAQLDAIYINNEQNHVTEFSIEQTQSDVNQKQSKVEQMQSNLEREPNEEQEKNNPHKVNNSKLIFNVKEFRMAKIFLDDELSSTQRLQSIQTLQLFQANFEHCRIMDKLIGNSIFIRKNRRNFFKYFRKKFIFVSFFLRIN